MKRTVNKPESKKDVDFRDIQDRLIKMFESSGNLLYERVDVQTIPCIQYFKTVSVGRFRKTNDDMPQMTFYFSTANDLVGVKSREELPERWVRDFIVQNAEYAKRYDDEYPSVLKSLVTSNVSELVLKMGIFGL